jgi:dipeptidase E
MKLALYGGGDALDNIDLDSTLLSLLAKNKKIKMTFIPAHSYQSELDFISFVKQYKKFKVNRFIYFPVDVNFDQVMLNEVFTSDIIHLGGGNTFYFLKHLRQKKILTRLKQFVKAGGILTGLSAGAIMLTADIITASLPSFDRDDNEDNVTNLNALNLVDFLFFPHYHNSKRYDDELLYYSSQVNKPLYAAFDGAGIIVHQNKKIFVGKNYCFYQGEKFRVV